MSRHGRKVPVSFYHHFTRDAVALAERYAQGRIISVLEGGYSDRALISGAMAHLCGLADLRGLDVDQNWWSVQNLDKVSPTRLFSLAKLGVILPNSSSKQPRSDEEINHGSLNIGSSVLLRSYHASILALHIISVHMPRRHGMPTCRHRLP
jgi:hypothetical protein